MTPVETIFFGVFVVLIYAAIGAVIGAVFLRLVVRWTQGFEPTFKSAYLAAFYVAAAWGVILVIVGMTPLPQNLAMILALVPLIVIAPIVYGRQFKHPERGPIGVARGAAVFAALLGFAAVLLGIVLLMISQGTA